MKQHEELHKNVSISVNRLQAAGGGDGGDESTFATISNNSIIEFLNDEQKCLSSAVDNNNESEVDIESIFEEINRLSDTSDERSVDEILREAELLLSKQQQIESNLNGNDNGIGDDGAKSIDANRNDEFFKKWQFDEHLKTISEESTPRNMKSHSSDSHGDDDVMQQQPNGVLEREHNVSMHVCRPMQAHAKQINNKQGFFSIVFFRSFFFRCFAYKYKQFENKLMKFRYTYIIIIWRLTIK